MSGSFLFWIQHFNFFRPSWDTLWSVLTTPPSLNDQHSAANSEGTVCFYRGDLLNSSIIQYSALPVLCWTLVPCAFSSFRSSCCLVVGWSITMLVMIFAPWGRIYHKAPDWVKLWLFYTFKNSNSFSTMFFFYHKVAKNWLQKCLFSSPTYLEVSS